MKSGSRGRGFTYLGALFLAATSAAALMSIVEFWSHARQREKETELLWIGNQFEQAIALYYHRSPGSVKRYPEKLEDLLDDRRHLNTARYLRKIYVDPMTGKSDWGLILAPGGGIVGVHSLSSAQPIRQVNDARTYTEWRFIYHPPAVRPKAKQD